MLAVEEARKEARKVARKVVGMAVMEMETEVAKAARAE